MHHRSNVLKYDAKHAHEHLVSAETFGYLINLSGRQRMLSQRVILNAMLAEMGDVTALDCAQKALTLFAESHQILIEGDHHLPGVCFDSLKAIYFHEGHADKKIRHFIALATETIEHIKNSHEAKVAERLGPLATPLVELLNEITARYEQEAKAHSLAQQKQYRSLMSNIQQIAKQARIVSVNAQIMAARAGEAGREFSVVASVLSGITEEIDALIVTALAASP